MRKREFYYLSGETLVGSVCQKETDDSVVILLRCHVQRRESVLRLDIDRCAIEDENLDNLFFSSYT